MNDKWATRFELVRGFGWMALAGIVLLFAAIFTPSDYERWPLIFGFLLCLPGLIYINLVTIWHWKARYRGNHSDLWGALILIETSGWMKLVYLFRHLIPDMRHTGRYRNPM
jgi:hypothetical protein